MTCATSSTRSSSPTCAVQGEGQRAGHHPNYKIGEIFVEIDNKIRSGYSLREIIDHIDELRFRSQAEKHELSHLYEAKIKNMGNAGRNGGEYYTPRPLIRAMVQVVQPNIGQRIYDGACGSGGFLCEAFDFLKARKGLTTRDLRTLQERTFYGKEKKVPGLRHRHHEHDPARDRRAQHPAHQHPGREPGRHPRQGSRRRGFSQSAFGAKSARRCSRTSHPHWRDRVPVPATLHPHAQGPWPRRPWSSRTPSCPTRQRLVSLRKHLLESCNLHTVLDCPGGTFQGAA